MSRYYSNMDGLLRAQFAYPNVVFRNIVAPSTDMPSSYYPLNLKQADVDTIYQLGVTDGTAAAQADSTNTTDFTQYLTLKKKGDKRIMGGVSFDTFLSMKQNGDIEEYNLLKDKQMQALFLQ